MKGNRIGNRQDKVVNVGQSFHGRIITKLTVIKKMSRIVACDLSMIVAQSQPTVYITDERERRVVSRVT